MYVQILLTEIKINRLKTYLSLAFISILSLASCNKYQSVPYGNNNPGTPPSERKVRFELFTNENFSGDRKNIQFTVHIGKAPLPVFDSTLATMKIEDIPDSAHRIVIEKSIPVNDTTTLEVGFLYTIENVGNSWYLEAFPGNQSFKLIRYSFK